MHERNWSQTERWSSIYVRNELKLNCNQMYVLEMKFNQTGEDIYIYILYIYIYIWNGVKQGGIYIYVHIRTEDKQKKIYARISWTKGSFIQAIEMCLNPSQHYLSSSLFLFLWTLSSNQNLTNISLYLFFVSLTDCEIPSRCLIVGIEMKYCNMSISLHLQFVQC